MKARDSGEDLFMIQNAKTTFGKTKDATGTAGRAPQRPNCGSGQSFEVRGESASRLTVGSIPFVELVFNGLWPRGLRHGAKDVGQTMVGKCLPFFDPWVSVCLRTVSKEVWTAR